ncbi:cytochrome c [uncultured Litoreibacter sp.]|uniref:c-type cytochrome n=1 Tax=uncultured Litoreibacter sp. TaxID=1392394 RepID=UPI00260CB437|nr:cytochrome c [uncultured Litoreibacter sp.]
MKKSTILAMSLALATGTVAIAGGHGGNPAVKARNAHMGLYGYNLGILGDMAKGTTEYNADAAKTAATNLATLAAMDQSSYWPEGTAQGEVEGSRAKAEIWTDGGGIMKHVVELQTASAALADVAGNGLEALQGGIGGAGKVCGDCHKAYRGPRN